MLGLPTEGEIGDRRRIGAHVRPAATVGVQAVIGDAPSLEASGGPIAVVDENSGLLGSLDAAALRLPADTPVETAMIGAPGTIRPELRPDDALRQLHDDGPDQERMADLTATELLPHYS